MRRAAIALCALLATAAPAAADVTVDMPGRVFAPAQLQLLTGETVTWRNSDRLAHHVRADDRSFDSGRMASGAVFARRFDTPGRFPYVCVLHRGMRGTISVAAIALEVPSAPVEPGAAVGLTGRAPAGTGEVAVVDARSGAVLATAAAAPGGEFATSITVAGPLAVRAVAGGLASATRPVAVAAPVDLRARRAGGRVTVEVDAGSGQAGAVVVLERHERERFGFVALRRARLDGAGRARIVVRTHRRLRLRAHLVRPAGGYARSLSQVVVITRRGAARGPDGHRH